MRDYRFQFSYSAGLASVTGVLGVLSLVAYFVTEWNPIGALSIHLALASCLFRARAWVCAIGAKERNAFELGRDAARVRTLH